MTKFLLPSVFFLALLLAGSGAPTPAAGPLDAARAALRANDLPQTETLLALLTAPGAADAAAFHLLGQLRERQKKFPDAVTAYEQATKLDATRADYFSALGIALSRRMAELPFMQQAVFAGKMKKAFEKSVALDPGHVPGLIGLARFYANAPEIAGGSLDRAAEIAGRLKVIDAFLGETELGNVAERGEKYDEALAHYDAAVRLHPDHAGSHYACGRQLVKLGRPAEARLRFATAVQLNPDFEPARKALAELDAPKAADVH